MHSYRIVWEDEAKAREIELFVHYRLDAGAVSIREIRPTQVTLYNSSTRQPSRSLPVHTAKGRSLLASAYLARSPLTDHVGRIMFVSVAIFGVATVVFGTSTLLMLSLAALVVLGAADMVSVVIRSTLIQLDTPDAMRGRVSAVNSLFTGTSNQLGQFWAGVMATLMGTVPAVVFGGCSTLVVVALWMRLFPGLDRRRRLTRTEPSPEAP